MIDAVILAVAVDHCAVLELNHFHDGQGQLVFSQLIFWDWDGEALTVRAWRFEKHGRRPQRDFRRGGWRFTWVGGSGQLRHVRAASWRETWTQHDPEVMDRERTAQEKRRGLTCPRRVKQR